MKFCFFHKWVIDWNPYAPKRTCSKCGKFQIADMVANKWVTIG